MVGIGESKVELWITDCRIRSEILLGVPVIVESQ
jgi:hypothetical protein